MKKPTLTLSILALCFGSGSAHAAPRVAQAQPILTVSIFNDAGVPATVLSRAQIRSTSILQRAGISLIWLDCARPAASAPEPSCSAIAFPEHLSIRLVSRSAGTPGDAFGQSFLDAHGEGSYALAYVQQLLGSKSKPIGIIDSSDLLGFVIAHELGHLLLGLDSHSSTGLMSAVWGRDELDQAARGRLFFTIAQQGRIQSRLSAAIAILRKTDSHLQTHAGD